MVFWEKKINWISLEAGPVGVLPTLYTTQLLIYFSASQKRLTVNCEDSSPNFLITPRLESPPEFFLVVVVAAGRTFGK